MSWYRLHWSDFQHKKSAKIEEQRRKDLTLAQVQNEEHRHTLQTHTQNKEQILRRASQVTFVKNIYIAKIYFVFENIVEWAMLLKCLPVKSNSEPYTLLFSFSLICKVDAVKKKRKKENNIYIYIYRFRVSLGS